MGFKMPHNGEGPHIIGSLKGAPPLKFKGVQELYLDVQEHLRWVQRKVNNTLRYNHDDQELSLKLGHISNMVFKMPQDGEGFSVVEFLSGYQLCRVLLPSCSILKPDDRFAHQNRYGFPPEFFSGFTLARHSSHSFGTQLVCSGYSPPAILSLRFWV